MYYIINILSLSTFGIEKYPVSTILDSVRIYKCLDCRYTIMKYKSGSVSQHFFSWFIVPDSWPVECLILMWHVHASVCLVRMYVSIIPNVGRCCVVYACQCYRKRALRPRAAQRSRKRDVPPKCDLPPPSSVAIPFHSLRWLLWFFNFSHGSRLRLSSTHIPHMGGIYIHSDNILCIWKVKIYQNPVKHTKFLHLRLT